MKDIVIIGSGGLAREIRWLLDRCNERDKKWNILGFVSKEKQGSIVDGLKVLGDDAWLTAYQKDISAVIAVGNGRIRQNIAERYKDCGNIDFPSIVAPSVVMSDSVKHGKGCIIADGCIMTVGITLGDFVLVDRLSTVGHDAIIDDYNTLLPGTVVSGNVHLGTGVTFGTGAKIIQGLNVGQNTFVGAGAVVIRDLPSNCTAVGVPAKIISENN